MHKAGFVNIVGNPNVGKSTLMNLLVGEHISIATFKAQTTRHRIMGIVNTEDSQIVFSDTPGVLKPNYKLQESMLAFSESALVDADVLIIFIKSKPSNLRKQLRSSILLIEHHVLCSVISVMSNSLQPMDCSQPGSSVHGILQEKILECPPRGSSWPRNWTHISDVACIAGRFFIHWATWEVSYPSCKCLILLCWYWSCLHAESVTYFCLCAGAERPRLGFCLGVRKWWKEQRPLLLWWLHQQHLYYLHQQHSWKWKEALVPGRVFIYTGHNLQQWRVLW